MMNKWITYLVAVSMACVVVACGNVNSQSAMQNESVAADNAEQHEVLMTDDAVQGPVHINTEEEFEQLVAGRDAVKNWKYNGKKPCVVDFYATWCKPCAAMAPIYEALAKEYGDRINFYKVDVDVLKDLSIYWGITGIPTFIFCNKKECSVLVGYREAEQLKAQLEKLL